MMDSKMTEEDKERQAGFDLDTINRAEAIFMDKKRMAAVKEFHERQGVAIVRNTKPAKKPPPKRPAASKKKS